MSCRSGAAACFCTCASQYVEVIFDSSVLTQQIWINSPNVCMQEWLLQHGRSQQDVASLREGYMQALGKSTLAVLTFHEFVKTWGWLNSTLGLMAAGDDGDNSEPPAKERPPDSNGEAAAA